MLKSKGSPPFILLIIFYLNYIYVAIFICYFIEKYVYYILVCIIVNGALFVTFLILSSFQKLTGASSKVKIYPTLSDNESPCCVQ